MGKEDFRMVIRAVILPFSRSSRKVTESFWKIFIPDIFRIAANTGLAVSDCEVKATLTEIFPLLPIKPNTKIKIRGKAILNNTAEGLRKIARKLALVMANMALI